ncbi:MAG: DUF1203 domain-containing protein [Rhodobacteraceae bacterium]|nr:DUF1203 domain-containing protein [Paracoccaceae bacterium]
MPITYSAITTSEVRALQNGGLDANGMVPERAVSDGKGKPCRHCLRTIPAGADMLVLAFRPFNDLHPYAETGPIFLCAEPCERYETSAQIPEVLSVSPTYLIKGYSAKNRIVYGTGAIVPGAELPSAAGQILTDPNVAHVHVRSASNNCYLARIDRG